ncbi:MAG TPA: hypothetical protein VK025_02215 [Steroidobacter sp.]|nr:hypothetical protein [Steroidobacter sp.]
MRRFAGDVFLAVAFGLWAAQATADQQGQVVLQLQAEVRETLRTPEGREIARFVPANVLSQGEVVYYTVRIRNPTSVYLKDVAVVQRIPANTTYVAGSAAAPAADIEFSIDGGRTFHPPSQLLVNVEGRPVSADVAHYTHIRWRLRNALAPGAVALARFRAVFQ